VKKFVVLAAPRLMLAMLYCCWRAMTIFGTRKVAVAVVRDSDYGERERRDDFWHFGFTIGTGAAGGPATPMSSGTTRPIRHGSRRSAGSLADDRIGLCRAAGRCARRLNRACNTLIVAATDPFVAPARWPGNRSGMK
jgi:hypothetical protein